MVEMGSMYSIMSGMSTFYSTLAFLQRQQIKEDTFFSSGLGLLHTNPSIASVSASCASVAQENIPVVWRSDQKLQEILGVLGPCFTVISAVGVGSVLDLWNLLKSGRGWRHRRDPG